MSNLYQILGVNKNASQNEINSSAQKKLKEIQTMKKSSKEKNYYQIILWKLLIF